MRYASRLIFAAFLLLAAWPARAGEVGFRLLTDPYAAVDSYPTRVIFDTAFDPVTALSAPLVVREGDSFRITANAGGCMITCAPELEPLTVDLGLLPAGEYEVELLVVWPGGWDQEPYPFRNYRLTVAPGPRLSFLPPHPVAGEAASLRLDGVVGRCPKVDSVAVQGSTVAVELALEECADPPAAASLVAPLGALPAGSYEVKVTAGQNLARGELEVLPALAVLHGGRFEVGARWENAAGEEGPGRLVQLPSNDSALFYFFNKANWELMVKVLDGCAINGHYWVFTAASTDVAYHVTVRQEGGAAFETGNPLGQPAKAINSITAFPCP